jgi:hypothetical protein
MPLRKKMCLSGVVLFVLLSLGFVVLVEADSSMWSQTYGGAGPGTAYALVETSDGGYALAGYTSVGNGDCWLVKTNEFGYMEWNRTYGGSHWDYAYSLVATSDGGYAIAGSTHSVSSSIYDDVWLVKADALGNEEWNRTYGGASWDGAYSLVETSDGGYALAGYTSQSGLGSWDVWLIKTDAAGNVEWNQTYGGADYDDARSLVVTSDGGYALAGRTKSFGAGEEDFWLVKTDEFGNMEWNQTYGGEGNDEAYALVAASGGGYVVAGTWDFVEYINLESGEEVSQGDFWLVKTDEFGNMEWNQTYGGTDLDVAYALIATADEGYALAGRTDSFGDGDGNFWLVKTDEYGVVPEGSSWLIPSLLLAATLVALIYKKRQFIHVHK